MFQDPGTLRHGRHFVRLFDTREASVQFRGLRFVEGGLAVLQRDEFAVGDFGVLGVLMLMLLYLELLLRGSLLRMALLRMADRCFEFPSKSAGCRERIIFSLQ